MAISNVRIVLLALLLLPCSMLFAAVSPPDGATLDTALTATLRWQYPVHAPGITPALRQTLDVSTKPDLSAPIVHAEFAENRTTYRLAVAPQTTYYWQVAPTDDKGPRPDLAVRGHFTSAAPRIDTTEDDTIRYKNPREGAHWTGEKPVEFAQAEPLSPWFDRKGNLDGPMPTFESLKQQFPVPVYDGHPEVLDAYWYCWKTLLGVWYFAPDAPDHQAVANICGIKAWGVWGQHDGLRYRVHHALRALRQRGLSLRHCVRQLLCAPTRQRFHLPRER